MSHTPRPWKVHRAIWDQETGDVAYILEGVKEARAADSYLITAAPDMLRAMEAVSGESEESDYLTQAQIYGMCRSAIRKARGEE